MRRLLFALGLTGLVACSPEWTVYGEEVDIDALRSDAVSVSEGVAQRVGPVTVEGEIGAVCTAGCWFRMMDSSELLFVRRDESTAWVIPSDSGGELAVARGSLAGEGESLELIATTVAILD